MTLYVLAESAACTRHTNAMAAYSLSGSLLAAARDDLLGPHRRGRRASPEPSRWNSFRGLAFAPIQEA